MKIDKERYTPTQTPKEMLATVVDFVDLDNIMNQIGEIRSDTTQELFTPDIINAKLAEFRQEKDPAKRERILLRITNKFGLRDKIRELLEKERKMEEETNQETA